MDAIISAQSPRPAATPSAAASREKHNSMIFECNLCLTIHWTVVSKEKNKFLAFLPKRMRLTDKKIQKCFFHFWWVQQRFQGYNFFCAEGISTLYSQPLWGTFHLRSGQITPFEKCQGSHPATITHSNNQLPSSFLLDWKINWKGRKTYWNCPKLPSRKGARELV